MGILKPLFDNNRAWAQALVEKDPRFFERLNQQQSPQYLWIGCSDSRVPANEIVGLLPGELFVHRNVANIVVHSDLNCLSVLQYAVDVLHVSHVIVCGHYGCGGVTAAYADTRLGLINNWLRHIQDVAHKHDDFLHEVKSQDDRVALLCDLNVVEQVVNVCQTTIVQTAWERGQAVSVHGWIYAISDGILKDLKVTVRDAESLAGIYKSALNDLRGKWLS